MAKSPKQPKIHPLVKLLREAEQRMRTDDLSIELQQSLTPLVVSLFTTYAQNREYFSLKGDMLDLPGQYHIKHVFEIAAAGGHNVLLVGPSDAGEVELARLLPSILPLLSQSYPLLEPACTIEKEALEQGILAELTRARGGVLFLKDLHAFDPLVLSNLARTVRIQVNLLSNRDLSVAHPAAFLLVATVKPCPCGEALEPARECCCSPQEIAQYKQRLKEVVHACFDIELEVVRTTYERNEEILKIFPEESSAVIRQRVEAAHLIQRKRYAGNTHLHRNADLADPDEIKHYCQMHFLAEDLLPYVRNQLNPTPLQMLRLLVVARTIADLDDFNLIDGKHMAEAILYLSRFIRDEQHSSS